MKRIHSIFSLQNHRRWLLLLLFCGVSSCLFSQTFPIEKGLCPYPAGSVQNMGIVAPGGDLSGKTILAQDFTAPTLTVTSTSVIGGTPPVETPLPDLATFTAVSGITINIASQITFTGSIDAAAAGLTFKITVRVTDGPDICDRTFSFDVARKPIDLVLVLDKSGSMTTLMDGQPRWDRLKSGVSQFFTNYQPGLLASGDQVGIRMFSNTDAAPVNSPFNVNTLVAVNPSTALANILNGDSPGGGTAMGKGLQSGYNLLFPGGPDNGHKKSIILFTDGEQNVSPHVVAMAGSNPTVSGVDMTHGDEVEIHTIGLGVAGAASQTLFNTANESGGVSNIVNLAAAPDLNLNMYLDNISQELLSGSSPQYVDVRRDKFKLTGNSYGCSESFIASKYIDKILINLITDSKNSARINEVDNGGKKLNLNDTSYVRSISGNGFQTLIIRVSQVAKKIAGFKSEGTWTVRVTGKMTSPAPYILSFTVDDHNAKMNGSIDSQQEIIAGNPLPVSISLTGQGLPISGATAMAILAKPGEDLGDLLARTSADLDYSEAPDADNPGTQKYLELLKDSLFVKKLLGSKQSVNLVYDATTETYKGQLAGLDLSGVYNVAYTVSVNDATLGEIRRYGEESIYVRFPDVDLAASDVAFTAATGILTFRPIASNGRYIGPGWANAIKVDSSSAQIQTIVDHGDGRYTVTIQGADAYGKLSLGGFAVYRGTLADIAEGPKDQIWKKWWFWLIVIIILIILIRVLKKKNP